MANRSSGFNHRNDIASNSSLTASASEFIPGSASHSSRLNPERMSFDSNNQSDNNPSFELNSYKRTGTRPFFSSNQSAYNKSTRQLRRQDEGSFSTRPSSSREFNVEPKINGSSLQDGNPRSSFMSRHEVDKSRSYSRFGSGPRKDFKSRNDGNSLNSACASEGAVGGSVEPSDFHVAPGSFQEKAPYFRENKSGMNKMKDPNENKNPVAEYRNQPDKNQARGSNDKEMQRQNSFDKPYNRDKGRNSSRETDHGHERNRDWSRRPYYERDTESYSESGAPFRGYSRHYDSSSDHYPSRQNRKYGDYRQEKNRDNWNREQGGSDSFVQDGGSAYQGNRQFSEMNKNQSQNRCYFQRERGFNSSSMKKSNTEALKSQSSDTFKDCSSSSSPFNRGPKSRLKTFNAKEGDDVSQRERLMEQLSRGTLECLVCCDRVRQLDPVWSCTNCFHVLHMRCVVKWAKSSKSDSGWRCPACQNISLKIPSQYRCFCGKAVEPHWNRQDTPHTCGEVCGKSREFQRPLCTHNCTLLCHPGPCPSCVIQVTRNCGCGKTSEVVKCGSVKPLVCDSVCEKLQNCGAHVCPKLCHTDPCEPCTQKIKQVCFCGEQKREVDCSVENLGVDKYSCSGICNRPLKCANHSCEEVCHPGDCKACSLTPDVVTHCPCGQTQLSSDPEHLRQSCTDPIPTCDKICRRKLRCGQPSNPHLCKVKCHVGDCPPCPSTTMVRCRCGHMDREIPCEDLTTKADDARCEKKCTKKRSCAKHKCNQPCCIEVEHLCPLPCNHTLSCGRHRCEQLCHRGHCRPCWRTSFEELYCECGTEVLYPPIACGTKPPPCSRPCSRQHECDHDALHSCHSEANCPPCTVLTQKYCYGKHELRKSIPCHQTEFSCGLACNKDLSCGRHKCIQICHKDECMHSGMVCTQPCTIPRSSCQHPCSAPCHDGPCPDIPCKETVRVTCECGHRSAMRLCAENTKEYQRIATSLLASKMADVQLGHSIDIRDIMGNPSTRKLYLKSLDCNDECKIIERNRRMAIGLQIRNPDLSSKLTPRYSDFMRGWAKKDPTFCQMIHDKLTELVKLAQVSKQKSRSYSFEVMNREKRQFVHEYCEHFGCESVAYDQEPKRNVVATAQKTKAWLPSISLLELVQRESGQRKVPGPMLNSSKRLTLKAVDSVPNKWVTKPSVGGRPTSASTSVSQPAVAETEGSSDPPYIDYFNL